MYPQKNVARTKIRRCAKSPGRWSTRPRSSVHFKDKQALLPELCDRDFGAVAHEFQKIARMKEPIGWLRHIGRPCSLKVWKNSSRVARSKGAAKTA